MPVRAVPSLRRTCARRGGLALAASLAVAAALGACGGDESAALPAGSVAPGASGKPGTPGVAPDGTPLATDRAREGASIALSSAGTELFVADEDHAALLVVPIPLGGTDPPTRVPMPGRPAQVVVLGSTVLVTVRTTETGAGALVLLDQKGPRELVETATVPLPADAWGLATSPDGQRAVVTSAWTAKVSSVDLASRQVRWTVDVPREPRGAAFAADAHTVFISHLVGSNLTRIESADGDPKVGPVELPAAPLRSPAAEKLPASLAYAIVPGPERDRLFVPRHALGALGSDAWFGTATVDALDVEGATPVAVARGVNAHKTFVGPVSELLGGKQKPFWWSAAFDIVSEGRDTFVQARAAVLRRSQGTLLIASEGTDSLVELDAAMSDPTLGTVRRYALAGDEKAKVPEADCGAPTGIALSNDERTAYVHCRSTDQVVAVLLPEGEGYAEAPQRAFTKLAEPASDPLYAAGRRHFYSARDGYVSGGLACAGCHPDGRDDGHVWHEVAFADADQPEGSRFTNFFGSANAARTMQAFWDGQVPHIANGDATGVGYARRTPIIAGRLRSKGPYGWRAESPTLEARLLAGFGLHRWRETYDATSAFPPVRARELAAFVREGLVPPPRDPSELSQEEQRGREIFMGERAGCATCHVPDTDYTNRSVAAFGPYPQRGYFDEKDALYKTPSLLFVGGSGPYFHDGRYATLEQLVAQNQDRMGKTTHLTTEEKAALVAFLKRL